MLCRVVPREPAVRQVRGGEIARRVHQVAGDDVLLLRVQLREIVYAERHLREVELARTAEAVAVARRVHVDLERHAVFDVDRAIRNGQRADRVRPHARRDGRSDGEELRAVVEDLLERAAALDAGEGQGVGVRGEAGTGGDARRAGRRNHAGIASTELALHDGDRAVEGTVLAEGPA